MKPIVKGFAEGYAHVIEEMDFDFLNSISGSVQDELNLFKQSIEYVTNNINRMIKSAQERNDTVTENILEVHKMLLDDETLIEAIEGKINSGKSAAESIDLVFNEWIETFSNMENAYMQERCTDLKDLKDSLLASLVELYGKSTPTQRNLEEKTASELEGLILFTKELTPSQLASMNASQLKGIVTETGGVTSHAAIMSRAMGIPMLVGSYESANLSGQKILMDGVNGQIVIGPSESQKTAFGHLKSAYEKFQNKLGIVETEPTLVTEEIHVNIGSTEDLKHCLSPKISGVGLFRTEFMFMKESDFPTEDSQYEVYRKVLEAFGNRPVTIRTIDIGGDKEVGYFNLPKEENPFLGYRAIRMCLGLHKEAFKTQLRAILRASAYGKARIMFPMIATVEETLEAKAILNDVKIELRDMKIAFDEHIPVGIMIETPSAAILAEEIGQHVDFFSLGTNDLTQYVMAADRMNKNLTYLYSYFEPAVLKLIENTIASANRLGIDVSVCGEMASDILAIPILKEIGLKKFSVSPSRVSSTLYVLSELISDTEKFSPMKAYQSKKETVTQSESFMRRILNDEFDWL